MNNRRFAHNQDAKIVGNANVIYPLFMVLFIYNWVFITCVKKQGCFTPLFCIILTINIQKY